jgi:hypothetical protein
MARSARFEDFRYVGDRSTQVVYDTDDPEVADAVDAAVASNTAIAFSPDTLAEARNRGYRVRRA